MRHGHLVQRLGSTLHGLAFLIELEFLKGRDLVPQTKPGQLLPLPRGTRVLVDCYANSPRRIERIAPHEVQARRIGHFGFFREQFQTTLWQRCAQLLHGFHTHKETSA